MRTTHRSLSLIAACALVLSPLAPLASGVAHAQEGREYRLADTATVASVDLEKKRLRVRTEAGKVHEFVVEDVTSILAADATPIALADLEPGERVVVNARRELEGEHEGETPVADRIQIVVDPTAAR
jgi:hypothetical protein